MIAATATRPLDPANAYYQRGRDKHNVGRDGQAVTDFEQAIKLNHDWAEPHYGLALSLAETGKLKEAIEEFKRVLKLTAQSQLKILSNYYMGDAYADLGEYENAIEAYKEAIRLDRTLPKPHYNLGVAYVGSAQLIAATDEFNEAVRLRLKQGSDYAEAHYNLGVAYAQLGRKREAEEQQRVLVKLNPKMAAKLEALIER